MLDRHGDQPILTCPTCAKTMTPCTFVRLALDRCDEHGMWFDGMELEQTLYQHAVT